MTFSPKFSDSLQAMRLWTTSTSELLAQFRPWFDLVVTKVWKRETLADLIEQWRSSDPSRPSSPEWERLTPRTKRTYETGLSKIERKWGSAPLAFFDNPRMHARICRWHESLADTPAGADNTLTVLQSLLNHGKRLNKLKLNAVSGIKDHYRAGQRADVVWTQEELDLFIRVAYRLNMADVADAVCVAWETGFRLQDLLTVRLRHIKPHRIIKQASKVSRGRRRYAAIPRTQALDVLLERLLAQPRAEGVDHILVTSKGKPWREHQLDIAFRAVRDACAIVHVDAKTGALRPKHLHDIRGTFATRLVTQTDLTDTEIAQIMAWAPSSVAQIRAFYVDHGAFAEALGRRLAA